MATPTEAEVRNQWRAAVDLLDQFRVYTDGQAAAGGEIDVLEQALEGDFTVGGLSAWVARLRDSWSQTLDGGFIYDAIAPCVLEYGKVLQAAGVPGSGYETVEQLMQTIYEWFIDDAEFVESRELTYDTSSTKTGTGDGDISRLTVDENAFNLEACHVEKKVFRCRRDQNSGVSQFAEEFEVLGETRSKDNLAFDANGSGALISTLIRNRNAGGGTGGSILRNSSFQSYDATQTNDFTNWQLVSGTVPTQEVTTGRQYTAFPGNTAFHAALFAATGRIKQDLKDMRVTRLNPFRPYFLRVMVNRDAGPGSQGAGSVVLHLGSQSESFTLSGSGWQEYSLTLDKDLWYKNFHQDDFNVEIDVTISSGDLLIDDAIFCEFDEIDGTFWVMRMNDATPASWLVDDELAFTDAQSDATKGKIQYFLFRAGLGYLPSTTGTVTFTDP